MSAEAHERGLVAFLSERQARRFLALLENQNRRKKLLQLLAHSIELDARYAWRIPHNQQVSGDIERLLKECGAGPECRVVSEGHLDGKMISLSEALAEVVPWNIGTFLSCVPGRLAYYQGEDRYEKYLLAQRGIVASDMIRLPPARRHR